VATFCRINAAPVRAEEGLSGILVPPGCTDAVGTYGIASKQLSTREKKNLDAEGRAVISQHLLNVRFILIIRKEIIIT
jgi:AP endonuclease-2